MSATLEQLEQQIMALPPKERAQLVDKLWDSLGGTTIPYLSDELERRRRDLETGKVKAVPGDQVMREARKRLKALHPE
jgi:putative addiction module component (TIGR02574 family)